ncbi:response regulator transcription factor [Jonesia quinghaiensis]|uniref:response regulator transcription factor n=1 Tax=Jonesia quinghaiensis TaxID=262806 RepID=UPI00041A693D|nr:response regulator transcription factor [Jonesia quinghaiensis]
MSEATTQDKRSVLVYSDDATVRHHVRQSIGNSIDGLAIEWHDVATYDALVERVQPGRYDLLILDGEARKAGGMGVAREVKNEVFDCPPILVLTGRAQDAWLASWSLADSAVARPLDPFELSSHVSKLLAQTSEKVRITP